MGGARLNEQTTKQLAALLSDERIDGERLLARLRELRTLESIPAFAVALRLLANLDLKDEEAERLLIELTGHRKDVSEALGRDPGLAVAAVDFLTNVKRMLHNPAVIDFSQLERTERSAITDTLTTLHNRRYFQGALEIEIRRSQRHSLRMGLLMLDLDFFKSVNDIYGHIFGDQVLRRAGHVVRRAVRESDIACRYGGDELAVILPETERMGAFAVADRIRRRIETDFARTPINGKLIAMTISGGLSVFPDDGKSAAALIECSDRALYHSKSRGKNGIVIHHAARRRQIRFPVRPTSRVEIVGSASHAGGAVQAINLSRGGALLLTQMEDPPAGPLELTLWEEDESWTIAGRVIRVEEPPSASGERQFAVAFDRPLPDICLRRSAYFASPARLRAESGP
jgi:diguanylate cyclase (GGDEF)-like protein